MNVVIDAHRVKIENRHAGRRMCCPGDSGDWCDLEVPPILERLAAQWSESLDRCICSVAPGVLFSKKRIAGWRLAEQSQSLFGFQGLEAGELLGH